MSELTDVIRGEIDARGVISFARFMELALYCPRLGYYENQPKQIGCQGDFQTSVHVGPVFGELLALQFHRWHEELFGTDDIPAKRTEPPSLALSVDSIKPGRRRPLQVLEAGAHDGQLARDILRWFEEHCPAKFADLEYRILEPSPERRRWQAAKLKRFHPQVAWFPSWDAVPERAFDGVIFSNELLDAFPVHRFGWNSAARCWFEWGVTWSGEQFLWKPLPPPDSPAREAIEGAIAPPELPDELQRVLPDGFITEVAPAAVRWWQQASRALRRGHLLTIDYGMEGADFFQPHRVRGTLRAYRRHRPSAAVLDTPGEQDLTAHVNFTALRVAGESDGLTTALFASQSRFLTSIFEHTLHDVSGPATWTPERLSQFKTLVHPEHFGRPFSVLVQSRL